MGFFQALQNLHRRMLALATHEAYQGGIRNPPHVLRGKVDFRRFFRFIHVRSRIEFDSHSSKGYRKIRIPER